MDIQPRQPRFSKRTKKALLLFSLMLTPCLPVTLGHAEPLTKYVDDFFYKLNGGRAIPRGAAGYITYRVGARFTANPGYTCGKFKMENNLKQAFENMKTQLSGLPGQISTAATEMVAALPMYLVKTYAPDIYGILTWNLDQAIELFRFEYKTCEMLESEMAKAEGEHNPYNTALRASVMNQWKYGAENNQSINQTSQEIKENPGRKGFDFLGKGRGTKENPVPIKHDLMVLAYNNRIGRTNEPLNESAPPDDQKNLALVQIWPTPKAAADWVVAATGEFWIVVDDEKPKSAPGVGIRPEIDLLTDRYEQAIVNAVNLDDFQELDELGLTVPPNLRISDRVISALRNLPDDKRAVATSRLASDTAVAIVKNKADLATTLFRSAVQDPDVATSQISSIAAKVSDDTRKWLSEEMEEVATSMQMARIGLGTTPLLIMGQSMVETLKKSTQTGSSPKNNNPAIQGGYPVAPAP
ncbi:conserved hypothetical protein [gamma proteobacterium HdN1]|nr:Hypothetical protein HDN1F_18020 [gamma proteobacterium HdN1]CBL47099.1 conserved hypothetical protein [gamma proteobacterium HdN1]